MWREGPLVRHTLALRAGDSGRGRQLPPGAQVLHPLALVRRLLATCEWGARRTSCQITERGLGRTRSALHMVNLTVMTDML